MSRAIDLTGVHFGRLTVLSRSDKKDSTNTRSFWNCVCDCGNTTVVHRANLKSGRTLSCGCLHRENAREQATIHGGYGTRLHRIWRGMLDRCYNELTPNYSNYGGRGIAVCEEWHNFEVFRDWALHNGYRSNLSLDRENNDGNYEPNNCRWATKRQQSNNTRRTVYVEFSGVTRPLSEWADITGINRQALWKRICQRGWPIEKALTTPLKNNGH